MDTPGPPATHLLPDGIGFDAVVVLSFGGPEGPDDVVPFLENVLRGRPVPPGRIEEVASHYLHFGGRSPINDQNRALVSALREELSSRGRSLPVYWANRHWHPYLADTLVDMRDAGIRRAAVFVTSAYSTNSGCRQYLDELAAARARVGPGAPELVKLRPFFNHPGFVIPLAEGLVVSLAEAGAGAAVLMSAHSIPVAQATTCDYERQLAETGRLVAGAAGLSRPWSLVYQSRSGRPSDPWLGPDVVEALRDLAGTDTAVVVPIGFTSDHMEVVYDLDTEAAAHARSLGIRLARSATPGCHPRFVAMICELIDEMDRPPTTLPQALGSLGPAPCPCRPGCCPPGPGR